MAIEISGKLKPGRHTSLLLFAAVLVLAAVLRLIGLGDSSLWPDEAFTWDLVRRPFLEMYQETIKDSHPPLFNVLAWAWVQVFGDSEFALRLPSALFGIASVFVLYLIGKRLWDVETGLVAAFALALSGFHIWYSQEFRAYSLLCLTAVLFIYSLVRIGRSASWCSYLFGTVSAALMLLSQIFGTFLFIGVNLFLGISWLVNSNLSAARLSKWIVSQVFAVLIFGYWGWQIFKMHSTKATWIPELGIYEFFLELGFLFNGPVAAVVMCVLAAFLIYERIAKSVMDRGNSGTAIPAGRPKRPVRVWDKGVAGVLG